MGMYDYLEGEQVKLFDFPCNPLKRNSNKLNDVFYQEHFIEGNFRRYKKGNKVPYRTLFYNYGENFIVFDYRYFSFEKEEPLIHVVENGIYVNSFRYSKIPDDLKIDLVVDKFGHPVNIVKKEDFKDIIDEFLFYDEKYFELINKYEKELNVFKVSIENFRSHTKEENKINIKKATEARDKAFKESFDIFNKKWIKDKLDPVVIGINKCSEFGYIIHSVKNNENIHEWEKYKIVQLFISEQIKDINELIEEYVSWVQDLTTKVEIVSIIDKYNSEIPNEVVKEYLRLNKDIIE